MFNESVTSFCFQDNFTDILLDTLHIRASNLTSLAILSLPLSSLSFWSGLFHPWIWICSLSRLIRICTVCQGICLGLPGCNVKRTIKGLLWPLLLSKLGLSFVSSLSEFSQNLNICFKYFTIHYIVSELFTHVTLFLFFGFFRSFEIVRNKCLCIKILRWINAKLAWMHVQGRQLC